MDTFRSFGRYASGKSIVRNATSEDCIRKVFAEAKRKNRRVVIRAGGHSFDDQALHEGDTGKSIVLLVGDFQRKSIKFAREESQVTLGADVRWGDFFQAALKSSRKTGGPLLIPASMQTARHATVGGTLSGDCLSRFSGTMAKESGSIVSFHLLTTYGEILNVNEDDYPDLFHAVIGGHGYLGFVLDATYRLVEVTMPSVAHTAISLFDSFPELVQRQLEIVRRNDGKMHAVSAAWFTDPLGIGGPSRIKGAVFDSWFAAPTGQLGFPLYDDIESETRYATEVLARTEPANTLAHEILFLLVKHHKGNFENKLRDFMFFMDGNTVAKERFEASTKQLFPIIQQTFVIPADKTALFAGNCEQKLRLHGIRPTESDMLYVKADECLMSANYRMDGFAVSFGFERSDSHELKHIEELLDELTQDCIDVGGRIHLVKSVYAQKTKLQQMFSPQIQEFEKIKRAYDPDLILQNTFSDGLFNFKRRKRPTSSSSGVSQTKSRYQVK